MQQSSHLGYTSAESSLGYTVSLSTHDFLTRVVSVDEISRAEMQAVKRAQRESFPDYCEALLKNVPLSPKSKLLALSPYMDETDKTRHHLILDPKHDVRRLVILHHHLQLVTRIC